MTPEELLKAGQAEEALASLQEAVRKAPADPRLRRFLFQLHCVLGRWDKALTQLSVLADLDAESLLLAQIFRPVIACETLRAEVFAGKRTPLIFGEPEEWIGWMVQANALAAKGEIAPAQQLSAQALEAAPATAGKINGAEFEWLADGDSRLGPLLEAYIDTKYYWIPCTRILSVTLAAPSDLRDLIWISAKFSWVNGGESSGFIPVRYPGSEAIPELRLSRRTDWQERGEGYYFGQGQRVWTTDSGEYPLLETRLLEFANSPVTVGVETAGADNLPLPAGEAA